jgi:hypothetical protein
VTGEAKSLTLWVLLELLELLELLVLLVLPYFQRPHTTKNFHFHLLMQPPCLCSPGLHEMKVVRLTPEAGTRNAPPPGPMLGLLHSRSSLRAQRSTHLQFDYTRDLATPSATGGVASRSSYRWRFELVPVA